ncbi:YdaS family helix-turn-helix protein [Alcaligenes sp. WGS1538]|uniref:YdaS family helix-turn-helix protein n=1 Tax=Alcaligenes sp. WGS1538 TaxID=3366811 RepID=UPI00372D3A45
MEKNPNISIAVAQAGGLTEAAKVTGAKSYQTVQQWIASGQVPARFCASLEAASGVSRFLLRPIDGHQIWPELVERVAELHQ